MITQIEAEKMLKESKIAAYLIVVGGSIGCIVTYIVMNTLM